MAKFDESKVINALHTEKAEVGKKYWCADSIVFLKDRTENDNSDYVYELASIRDCSCCRFITTEGYVWDLLYPYEEPKEQRMTNRQFAEWIAKSNGEYSFDGCAKNFLTFEYDEVEKDEEVDKDIVIRSWDSEEWVEPTVDIYLRDCKHLSQDEIDDIAYRYGC